MSNMIKNDEPEIIAEDDARGARSASKTTVGDTLMPMLVGGLILIVLGMTIVMLVI